MQSVLATTDPDDVMQAAHQSQSLAPSKGFFLGVVDAFEYVAVVDLHVCSKTNQDRCSRRRR